MSWPVALVIVVVVIAVAEVITASLVFQSRTQPKRDEVDDAIEDGQRININGMQSASALELAKEVTYQQRTQRKPRDG
jgi:hypothetical protein